MPDQVIAQRIFTMADQETFAALSGDRNPMHLDAIAARRTQAGAPVVHGVHAVLWSLEALCALGAPIDALLSAKVRFERFVFLDRRVTLRIVSRDDSSLNYEILDETLLLLTVKLSFKTSGEPTKFSNLINAIDYQNRIFEAGISTPLDISFAEMSEMAGRIIPMKRDEVVAALFPTMSQLMGTSRVCSLSLLSTLVGMFCPGLNSIFSYFSMELIPVDDTPGLTFQTTKADERFQMVTIGYQGCGIRGDVVAFARRPPATSASLNELVGLVEANEFASVSALIVGGSRGLGAAAAKLIAAGGGSVIISYVSGKREADLLQEEIYDIRGPNACRVIQLDVRDFSAIDSAISHVSFNQIYYFATPQIFRQKSELFSPSTYSHFSGLYVDSFYYVIDQAQKSSNGPLSVFYPSSSAVIDRPQGLTEYAMAKAAGEVLCADLQRGNSKINVIVARIPRTSTDQTSTIIPVESADPIDVMLPIVREMSISTALIAGPARRLV